MLLTKKGFEQSNKVTVLLTIKKHKRRENAVCTLCARRMRVVSTLKQLYARCIHERHGRYKDVLGTSCGRC